jgi:hypothetical protein
MVLAVVVTIVARRITASNNIVAKTSLAIGIIQWPRDTLILHTPFNDSCRDVTLSDDVEAVIVFAI